MHASLAYDPAYQSHFQHDEMIGLVADRIEV